MKKQRQHFRGMAEQESSYSDEQRRFHKIMQAKGYDCACCYGAEEAIERIKTYLGIHE